MIRIMVLALIGLLATTPAAAATKKVQEGQIRPFAEWVEKRTGVRFSTLPPVSVTDVRLGPHYRQNGGYMAARDEDVKALYLPSAEILIQSEYWQPGNLACDSLVIHELVHHAQKISGSWLDEATAYALQAVWHAEQVQCDFICELPPCD